MSSVTNDLDDQPPRRDAWQRARRILAVRLDQLGDVMMTTPALAALKHGAPDRHVTLLASPSSAALAPHLPVDAVIEAAVPWMKPGQPLAPQGLAELTEELRARGFDAAVIFTAHSQNPLPAALLCYQAGIPLRAAYCRENAYHLLTERLPEQEPQLGIRHEVERQLALVQSLGFDAPDTRLQFNVRDGDRLALARTLQVLGAPKSGPYIVLHPGANAAVAPLSRRALRRGAAPADTAHAAAGVRDGFSRRSAARAYVVDHAGAEARVHACQRAPDARRAWRAHRGRAAADLATTAGRCTSLRRSPRRWSISMRSPTRSTRPGRFRIACCITTCRAATA